MTQTEQSYIKQGYELPRGYSWEHVAAARAEFGIAEIYVPLAVGGGAGNGACAWGVPMIDGRFLSHE